MLLYCDIVLLCRVVLCGVVMCDVVFVICCMFVRVVVWLCVSVYMCVWVCVVRVLCLRFASCYAWFAWLRFVVVL